MSLICFCVPLSFWVLFITTQSGLIYRSPPYYLLTDFHTIFLLFCHHLPAPSLTLFTRYHSTEAKGSGGEEVLRVAPGKVWVPKTHEGDSSEAGGRGPAGNHLARGQPTPRGTSG